MGRRKWGAEEKMAIVMEILRGEKGVSQICRSYGVSESLTYRWRDEALEGMRDRLSGKQRNGNGMSDAEREKLLKLIGEQAYVIDYQKKISRQIGL